MIIAMMTISIVISQHGSYFSSLKTEKFWLRLLNRGPDGKRCAERVCSARAKALSHAPSGTASSAVDETMIPVPSSLDYAAGAIGTPTSPEKNPEAGHLPRSSFNRAIAVAARVSISESFREVFGNFYLGHLRTASLFLGDDS